jgi:hypothetical protein
MTAFVEVDMESFYAAIGPQNVIPSFANGSYPYTTEFITPLRELVRGRRVGYVPEGEALAKYRYFLPADKAPPCGGEERTPNAK